MLLALCLCVPALLGPGTRASDAPQATRERSDLSAAAYARRALEYLARPRPEDQSEAERLFRKALDLEPDRVMAHVGLSRIGVYRYTIGLDETRAGLAQALEEARRAIALAPGDASARSALALALAAADRTTPALEEARRAVELDPGSADAHLALGIVLRLRKDDSGALAACRRACEIAPESPRVLSALGEALREAGLYGEAMSMFGQAVDLDHEAILPQLGAAITLHKAGETSRAGRAYRHLQENWDYGQSRVRLGAAALLVSLEEFEPAVDMYSSIAIPENGAMPTLLALYGKGYSLLRLGREAEAEYFLSTLIERVPKDYDGPARGREILFRAYEDLVRYFEGRGRDGKVEELLGAACARSMAPTRLARTLAGRLESKGKIEAAGDVLERVILGSDPLEDPIDLSETALRLARLRSSGGRRRLRPSSPAAQALQLAATRIEASPLGTAHYRLARAQALASQGDAALQSLDRARRCGYRPLDLLAAEADFSRLRDTPAFQELLRP
jgi:tetratricopeptide (TPR) repeat protein